MAETNFGANPVDDGTIDPQTYTYDLFKFRKNDPNLGGKKLQDVYGRGGMPSFQWVEAIKDGTRTYTDTSAEDQARLAQAKADWDAAGGNASGQPNPVDVIAELAPIVSQAASGVLGSLAAGGTAMEGVPFTGTGSLDVDVNTTYFDPNKLNKIQVDKLNATGAITPDGMIDSTVASEALGGAEQVQSAGGIIGANQAVPGTSFIDMLNPGTDAGMQNLKSAGGAALGNFGVQLLLGQDPVKAAKSAGAGAIGQAIGTAIFGPVGGAIGGAIGSVFGGRVICNELMRQGLLTRKEVVLDYKFTRDYLTPTHVNGYHIWAVWMVKQMRQGRFINFWKHVAGHRANEIAYIYGETDKPDYLGKVYRKILEPTCWVLGKFCDRTDWSVLYKQKEI